MSAKQHTHSQDVDNDDALPMAKSFQKAKDKHRKKGDKLGNCKKRSLGNPMPFMALLWSLTIQIEFIAQHAVSSTGSMTLYLSLRACSPSRRAVAHKNGASTRTRASTEPTNTEREKERKIENNSSF